MGVKWGSAPLTGIYYGSTKLSGIYYGSTPLWAANAGTYDGFDAGDLADSLGTAWTDLGTSTDHKLGRQNGRVRLTIPDGEIGGFWAYRTSRARFNVAVNPGDDGFVETRPMTQGDGWQITGALVPYISAIYGRSNNTGSTHTAGVGFQMVASNVSLVKRVSSLETQVSDAVAFQQGDRIRHTFVGNDHKLFLNGHQVEEWNDTGATASKGSTFRSLVIRGDAGKDLLGPRRFSPSLDYALMG